MNVSVHANDHFSPDYVLQNYVNVTIQRVLGGSPGLVAMGGDSCSKGCGFESQQCILDGLLLH